MHLVITEHTVGLLLDAAIGGVYENHRAAERAAKKLDEEGTYRVVKVFPAQIEIGIQKVRKVTVRGVDGDQKKRPSVEASDPF